MHSHTHESTVQERDDGREGSASSVPCPEPETLLRGQASVSTPLQSTADSPSLERAPAPAATPATPASEQGSPSVGPSSGGPEPLQSLVEAAEAIVDEVFSTVQEILSAPDSPHKEFHCAVLRALSKEPLVTEVAKADQAPGTPDEAESCLKSGLPLPSPPRSALARLTPYRCLGNCGEPLPAVSSPFSGGSESTAIVLPPYPQSSKPFA